MSRHSLEVMQRRQVLLAKIAAQREQLAVIETRLQPAFHVADQARVAVKFLRAHPVLVAGVAGVTGLLVVRGRGLEGLVKGVLRVWTAWRYVKEVSQKITRR